MIGILPLAQDTVNNILSVKEDIIGKGWVFKLQEGGFFLLESTQPGPRLPAVHVELWTPDEQIRLHEIVPIPGTVRCNPGEPCEAWLLYKLRHEQWREEVIKKMQGLAEQAGISQKPAELYKLADLNRLVPYKGRTT